MKLLDLFEKFNDVVQLRMTPEEARMSEGTNIVKLEYNLDRTQSYYRYDRTTYSMPFQGEQDLEQLQELVARVQ